MKISHLIEQLSEFHDDLDVTVRISSEVPQHELMTGSLSDMVVQEILQETPFPDEDVVVLLVGPDAL